MPARKMHQTTVRFGADLWEAVEHECERLGLSVAQYLREAALARLVYAAGRRGDHEFELALEVATGSAPGDADLAGDIPETERVLTPAGNAEPHMARARAEVTETSALWAQGQQARRRAQELRQEILERRDERNRRRG